jgi:2-polyprenyl-3-methyl-5-hydroxy-6-metoxy-1,4-benzoquinol methylase
MAENISYEKFTISKTDISRQTFDRRIIDVSGFLGWQSAAHRLIQSGIAFDKLNIIEIGCGTGTFCLAFALIGAKVTLLDIDEEALENARLAYSLYGLKPAMIKASVTEPPPRELLGKFAMSVSVGLAEHFIGDERINVIKFHRQLLNPAGFAVIGVPNKISPFYSVVRGIKTVLGQWDIKNELAFTPFELKSIGKKADYNDISVIGNNSISKDTSIYTKAALASILHVMPGPIISFIKKLISTVSPAKSNISTSDTANLKDYIIKQAYSSNKGSTRSWKLKDYISSGLYLIGK